MCVFVCVCVYVRMYVSGIITLLYVCTMYDTSVTSSTTENELHHAYESKEKTAS